MGYFTIVRERDTTPEGMRVCSTCGKLLPIDDFYHKRHRAMSSQRATSCKKCHNARVTARYHQRKTELQEAPA